MPKRLSLWVVALGLLCSASNAQMYYNAVKPDGWGSWQSRLQLQFLFPM